MLIKKILEGKVTRNYRSVSNSESGQKISETSDITIEGASEHAWLTRPYLEVDGLLPVGSPFRLILEEIERP